MNTIQPLAPANLLDNPLWAVYYDLINRWCRAGVTRAGELPPPHNHFWCSPNGPDLDPDIFWNAPMTEAIKGLHSADLPDLILDLQQRLAATPITPHLP